MFLPSIFKTNFETVNQARHSEVFEGMFSIPQPSSDHGMARYDGCQVVCVYDLPSELSILVTALYDGV